MEIKYSIQGKTCLGRWYQKPDRISIFLNKISERYDPNEKFELFISEMVATEFHEFGHIYGFRNGCKTTKCKEGKCFWCNASGRIRMWLCWNSGISAFKKTL